MESGVRATQRKARPLVQGSWVSLCVEAVEDIVVRGIVAGIEELTVAV